MQNSHKNEFQNFLNPFGSMQSNNAMDKCSRVFFFPAAKQFCDKQAYSQLTRMADIAANRAVHI